MSARAKLYKKEKAKEKKRKHRQKLADEVLATISEKSNVTMKSHEGSDTGVQ